MAEQHHQTRNSPVQSKQPGASPTAKLVSTWLTSLAAAFGVEINETRIAIYVEALKDIADNRLEIAFQTCLKGCRFFPTIADIREAAIGSQKDRDDSEAQQAW